jgi:hypothetical protein
VTADITCLGCVKRSVDCLNVGGLTCFTNTELVIIIISRKHFFVMHNREMFRDSEDHKVEETVKQNLVAYVRLLRSKYPQVPNFVPK